MQLCVFCIELFPGDDAVIELIFEPAELLLSVGYALFLGFVLVLLLLLEGFFLVVAVLVGDFVVRVLRHTAGNTEIFPLFLKACIFLVKLLTCYEPRTIVCKRVFKILLSLLDERVTLCLFGGCAFLGVGCCLTFSFVRGFLIVRIYLVPELCIRRPRVFGCAVQLFVKAPDEFFLADLALGESRLLCGIPLLERLRVVLECFAVVFKGFGVVFLRSGVRFGILSALLCHFGLFSHPVGVHVDTECVLPCNAAR